MNLRRYIGLFGFWLIRKACGNTPGCVWIREVSTHSPCPPLRPLDPRKPLVVYNLSLDGRDTEKFYPEHLTPVDFSRVRAETRPEKYPTLWAWPVSRDNPCDTVDGLTARLGEVGL